MPAFARLELEEALILCNRFRRIALPGTARHERRHKGLNVAAGALDLLSRLNADLHAFIPDAEPRDARVHLGIDVDRREERIEGAR